MPAYTKIKRESAGAKFDNFMKGYLDAQKVIDARAKAAQTQQASNSKSIKDMMIMQMIAQQNSLQQQMPAGGGTSAVGAARPANVAIKEQISRGQSPIGVNVPTNYSPEASLGLKEDPNTIAQREVQKSAATADIQKDKEVASQQEKKGAELAATTGQLLTVGETSFDQHLKFAKEQYKNLGVKPGDLFGLIDKLTPDQANEYKSAFNSAKNEAAALVGRTLIPGVRGAMITEIFASATAKVGNTLETSANNIAETSRNAVGTALHNNIRLAMEDGTYKPILQIVKDPKTGKVIGSINDFFERNEAINRFAKKFEKETRIKYLQRVQEEAPELLKKNTAKKIAASKKELKDVGNEWVEYGGVKIRKKV